MGGLKRNYKGFVPLWGEPFYLFTGGFSNVQKG